jgi:molybdopterin/thiamine biosynthesis adenylyltransferase
MEVIWPVGLRQPLRADLLGRAPREHGGAVLARINGVGNGQRILAISYVLPSEHEVNVHGEDALQIDPAFWARVSKDARRRHLSVLPVHTHPIGRGLPRFSPVDIAGERRLLPVLHRLTGAPTGAIVVAQDGETVAVWTHDGARIMGRSRDVAVAPDRTANVSTPTERMLSRNVRAFGPRGQARLSALTVAVVGASGTGSHVCEQLIRLGVGRILVIDDDIVEAENLNRIVTAYASDAVRKESKVTAVAKYAEAVGGPTAVTAVRGTVLDPRTAQQLEAVDAIICCTDTVSSRAVLNRLAIQRFIPLWDCGSEISTADSHRLRAFAHVRVVYPGAACLVCMDVIDPERLRVELMPDEERARDVNLGYIRTEAVVAPAVVSLNGLAASLTMMRFLEWAVGDLPTTPGHWVYRSLAGDVRDITPVRRDDCPVCSEEARLGRADLAVQL